MAEQVRLFSCDSVKSIGLMWQVCEGVVDLRMEIRTEDVCPERIAK
jgi:hypothetical protein